MQKPILAALVLLAGPALADDAAPVLDNARVTVRDIHLEPNTPGPVLSHAGDYIVLYFNGANFLTGTGGTTSDTSADRPAREIVVDLKNAPSNTVPNTTGLPPAFPREGSKLMLETPKVRVWKYTWLLGKPTVMHFHNTEVVVAYDGDGDIKAATPDGKSTVNHRATGDIVYNLAGRAHSEELVKGEVGGIMLELK